MIRTGTISRYIRTMPAAFLNMNKNLSSETPEKTTEKALQAAVENTMNELGVELSDFSVYPDYELKNLTAQELSEIKTSFKCTLFDDFDILLEDIFYRMV